MDMFQELESIGQWNAAPDVRHSQQAELRGKNRLQGLSPLSQLGSGAPLAPLPIPSGEVGLAERWREGVGHHDGDVAFPVPGIDGGQQGKPGQGGLPVLGE